jgi:hypothetical protein
MANEQYKILITIDGDDNVSAKLDKAKNSVKDLSDEADKGKKSAKSFGESWASFKDHAANFVGAAALVTGAIYKINELGAQANAAERTFNQVSGGVDMATASLARMREMTGGVIDDMALMKGASSLLVTGIADTNQKAEELVNLGARLSAVMGVDATEGIANLNSALLNNSFLRLDTLGISASRVRERVNELKDAGLDMSEAFSQAVIEIGTQTLTDLGDAANVAETAVARLTTSFNNLAQNVAQGINADLEKAATTLEQIIFLANVSMGNETGNAQIDAEIAKTEELTNRINELIAAREDARSASGVPVGSFLIGDISNQQFMDYAAQNPELMNAQGSFGAPSSNIASGSFFLNAFSGNTEDLEEARTILEELVGFELDDAPVEQLRMIAREADIAFSSIADAQSEMNEATEETTLTLINNAHAMEYQSRAASWFGQTLDVISKDAAKAEQATAWMRSGATGFTVDKGVKADSGSSWARSGASGFTADKDAKGTSSAWDMGGMSVQSDTLERYNALQDEAANGLTRMGNNADLLNGIFAQGRQITDDLVYFSPTQLGLIEDRAAGLTAEYERLLAIQETNPELVTEEEVARAKEIADSAESMAQDALTMADAWANASLGQIAGQGDGGRENEFNQMVLANIEDPELRAQMEAQLNLNSGVETANSRVLDYGADLVATIGEEDGSAAGARAAETLVTAFEEGVKLGLEGEALQDYIENELGYALAPESTGTGTGGQVTVQEGEGYIALAQRTGYTREELEAANGGQMLLAGQVINLPDGSSLIAVGESATPEDIATGILGNAQTLINGGVDNGINPNSVTTPNASFSYYDPMTGQVTEDTTQASQPLVPPEQGEIVSLMAEDMLTIETSITAIAATDTSVALDPMVEDVGLVSTGISEMQAGLETLASADYSIQMPIQFVFDTATAETLARNPTIIETVRLILPQVGVTSE